METANDSYLAHNFGQEGYWAYLGQGSNGTYDFEYLASFILKSVVDGRLIDQGGVRIGSSEVRCKYWVRDGKGIRMSGFGIVLLIV